MRDSLDKKALDAIRELYSDHVGVCEATTRKRLQVLLDELIQLVGTLPQPVGEG